MTPVQERLNKLVEESAFSLPTLPNVFVTVLDQVTKEHASADDVAAIISRDQSLVSRVLAVANSAAYGFRNKVSTVSRAVSLLGFDTIKNLVLSVSIFDELLEARKIVCFDKKQFWEHCLMCATVSREIARQMKIPFPDEAYVAGLLHDMGKVALDLAVRDIYAEIHAEASKNGHRLIVLEQEKLGTDHARIAGMLSSRWALPATIAAAIRCHHDLPETGLSERQKQMAAVVSAADFIAWTHGFGSLDSLHPPRLDDIVTKIVNIETLDMEKICEVMDQQIMSTANLFDLSVPNTKKFRKALMRANIELGRMNTLYEEAKRQLEHRVQELSRLSRAIYRLRQNLDVDATVKAILAAFRYDLGFSRAMFVRFDPTGKKFSLEEVLVAEDKQKEPPQLELNATKDGLLAKAIEQGDILHVQKASEQGNDPLMACLGSNEVLLLPLISKCGTVGVVIADDYEGDRPLSTYSRESLSILAQEASLSIENAMLFEKTKELAIRDDLTQLYNRRYCSEHLGAEIDRSKRYNHQLSVVLFDIDHFKNFNDNFGHQTGDRVLQAVARFLVGFSRDTDVVSRYGGEEFLVILPETTVDGALAYAERVRAAVEQFGKTKIEGVAHTDLTISGGVSSLTLISDTGESILDHADRALYTAKEAGRNRIAAL